MCLVWLFISLSILGELRAILTTPAPTLVRPSKWCALWCRLGSMRAIMLFVPLVWVA